MPHIPHWIEAQLSTHFEDLNLAVGVDFDGSGAIEGSELTDINNDGQVDADEWRAFLNQNESSLRNFGGFFNYYFDYGTTFKPDNPLHDLLFTESVLSTEFRIALSYQIVESIYNNVVNEFSSISNPTWLNIFSILRDAFRKSDTTYEFHTLFTDIADGNLDCDTWGDVVLAIAHEMNWPFSMVIVPGHAFVRYNEDGMRHDLEQISNGLTTDDYIQMGLVSQQAVDQGVWLKELDYNNLVGLYYFNVGDEYRTRNDYKSALNYFATAIKFYPNFLYAYTNSASIRIEIGDYKGAIADYNRIIELWPNNADNYYIRGTLKRNVGDTEGTIRDLQMAVDLEPDNTEYSMTLLEVQMLYWNSQDMGGGPF